MRCNRCDVTTQGFHVSVWNWCVAWKICTTPIGLRHIWIIAILIFDLPFYDCLGNLMIKSNQSKLKLWCQFAAECSMSSVLFTQSIDISCSTQFSGSLVTSGMLYPCCGNMQCQHECTFSFRVMMIRIFYREVPGFATDFNCSILSLGLTSSFFLEIYCKMGLQVWHNEKRSFLFFVCFTYILMLYYHLPYFHVANSSLFSIQYFSTLISHFLSFYYNGKVSHFTGSPVESHHTRLVIWSFDVSFPLCIWCGMCYSLN